MRVIPPPDKRLHAPPPRRPVMPPVGDTQSVVYPPGGSPPQDRRAPPRALRRCEPGGRPPARRPAEAKPGALPRGAFGCSVRRRARSLGRGEGGGEGRGLDDGTFTMLGRALLGRGAVGDRRPVLYEWKKSALWLSHAGPTQPLTPPAPAPAHSSRSLMRPMWAKSSRPGLAEGSGRRWFRMLW